MTTSEVLGLVGDVLVVVGFAITGLIYWRQRTNARKRDINSTLTMLEAVRDGMLPFWGDAFFQNGYDAHGASARAKDDFDHVMAGSFGQVFCVPVQPLTALIEQPGGLGLVRRETIEAANVALYRIGVFNQFVQQQTGFNTRHLAEIKDNIPDARRRVLAESARALSTMLHFHGIGDAGWYQNLKVELEANINELQGKR